MSAFGRDVAEGDRFPHEMPEAATRHPADDLAVVPDGLVADDVGGVLRIGVEDEGDEATRWALGCLRLVGGPADELMVEPYIALQAGLGDRVDRSVLPKPGAVALLEPEAHQRPHAEQAQSMRRAR